MPAAPRIVLAFSGSFETALAIPWLKEQHGADVITLTLDFGQGRELEAVRDRALAIGALRAHVLDVRDEFARELIVPALKADAAPGGRLILAHALARPLIARKLVEIAEIERAKAVSHGAAGEDGAPAPLDTLIEATNAGVIVLAPRREWRMSAADQRAYADAHGVPHNPAASHGCRVEANLWGRSIRCPAGTAPDDAYVLTRPAAECPNEAATVQILFERGIPKAINGVFMPLLELIASLGTIAAAHGVGRTHVDNDACEAPAAVVLHAAHRRLQAQCAPDELDAFAQTVSREYVNIIRRGLWFSPLREALDAFVDKVQQRVNGTVELKLFKGELAPPTT